MSVLTRCFCGGVAASLLFGSIAGCGGTGGAAGSGNVPNNIPLLGGVSTVTVLSPVSLTPEPYPQSILVALPGSPSPQTVWIPAGVAVGAAQALAVLPAHSVYIKNMTGGAPAPALSRTSPAPGTVLINGQASGVTMTNGVLSGNLGLPAGNYHEVDTGPFTVTSGGNGPPSVTVQSFEFYYTSNGTDLSFPTSATGYLPANGTNALGNYVKLTFPEAFNTGPATFTIISENGTITQTDPVTPNATTGLGYSTIHAETSTSGALQIPTTGVQSIIFSH